jgi:hypothetical protein
MIQKSFESKIDEYIDALMALSSGAQELRNPAFPPNVAPP